MKIRIITILFLSIFMTGCFFEDPTPPIVITKYKYIKQRINVPEPLFKTEKVLVPDLTEQLNVEDLKKIQIYILDLYSNNKQCISNLNAIEEILKEK